MPNTDPSVLVTDPIPQSTRCIQPLPRCYERVQRSDVSVPPSFQPDSYTERCSIDTPGVIDRVSTLFRGHPSLIQGFNTFLPPGYRIECSGSEGDQLITVTTPTGTVSQMPGGFSAALDQREKDREARENGSASRVDGAGEPGARRTSPNRYGAAQSSNQTLPPLHSHLASGPPPFQHRDLHANRPASSATGSGSNAAAGATPSRPGATTATSTPNHLPLPPHAQPPTAPSGPSTPSAAQFLASGMTASNPSNSQSATMLRMGGTNGPILEFNHAIAFVNKIKSRFNSDPETYKQFLEILQTYQRDTRDIADVSFQVRDACGN